MRFSSGTAVLDCLLGGGFRTGIVNTIYGPAASGKTTACMLAAIECAKRGKKVIYLDTEGGFSIERIKQMTPDYLAVMENVFLLRISSFGEQIKKFQLLPELSSSSKIGLVVVDTIGFHYRGARREEIYRETNSELAMQIEILQKLAKNENLVVMMTNQVYADVEQKDVVVPVGGDIIRKRSECMIELKLLEGTRRGARLVCHPDIKEEKEVAFEIAEEGFRGI